MKPSDKPMLPAWKRLLELAEPHWRAFEDGCSAPQITQERFLAETLRANTDTDIGRRLNFSQIRSAKHFAECVPVVRYADIEDELSAWQKGSSTLCAAAAVFTAWTSGSTRNAKRIPYSVAGLEAFRHALYPWLADLCSHETTIADGRVYWALSPAGTAAFADRAATNDAVYFGEAAALLEELTAVPPTLANLSDVVNWRFCTALFLAACEDLSLISIWSPTFLHAFLDILEHDTERIADAMLQPERHGLPRQFDAYLQPIRTDAQRHVKRLHAATRSGRLDTSILWPKLCRLSCWTHATASRHVAGLTARLGGVTIEPKGLLSTEAAVSLPVRAALNPVAAVTSTFLELCLDDGRCLPVWEWREGDEGRVLITTRSGLWRYDTGDRVCVSDFWKSTPCLVFLGRAGNCVDLCGEKLDETMVMERLPADVDAFQAPDADNQGYCLFVESAQVSDRQAGQLAARLDRALCEILHYRHARELGQLAAVRAVRVRGLIANIGQRAREARGTPLATAKFPVLDGDSGWLAYFAQAGALEMP